MNLSKLKILPLQKILLKIKRKATGWEEGNGPTKDNERQIYKKKKTFATEKQNIPIINNKLAKG